MDFEEMVPNETDGLSEVVEEAEVDTSEPISSVTDEDQGEPKAKEEPGYVRGRIDKAVTKVRSEMQAQFDQQIADIRAEYDKRLAPMMERMLEMDAQELVRSGQVKDLEIAKELVRLRNGQPAPVVEEAPQSDPATSARIAMLEHQAEQIKADSGVDVTEEFLRNEAIKQKVVSGEMDFYDVARYMKKRPPSPMRSPNGATGQNPNAIANMTSEQFAKLNKKIDEGARYSLR